MRASASTALSAIALLGAFTTTAALPASDSESSGEDASSVDAVEDEAAVPIISEAPRLEIRADPTAVWVSVDDEGRPATTLTPSLTTIDGTPSVIDGAPHDITATVFTQTYYGVVSTSTGNPPNPTATNKHEEGAFPRCFNQEGEYRPFCYPEANSTLYEDSTYYVTWDPDYFNNTLEEFSNATYEVSIRLDYFNRTDVDDDFAGEMIKLDELERVPVDWGVFPLYIKGDYLKGRRPHNVSITLLTSLRGSADRNASDSVLPVVLSKHEKPAPAPTRVPENRDLIIALPVTLGSLAAIMFGLWLWNRKTRRIALGNVMSRSRNRGYSGRKTRRRVFGRGDVADKYGIQLTSHPKMDPPLSHYRDDEAPPASTSSSRPRRDSDDLDDLVDSPVRTTFRDEDPGAGGNTFRDEMRRQDNERRGGPPRL